MPDEIEIPTMANAEDGKNPSAAGGQIRRSKSKHIKQCSICGQDCFYNYYSVQSCEGCKQFFRRCIVKRKLAYCSKSSSCDIMKGSRCRGCRMNRCLLMGMDPSLMNVPKTPELDRFIDKIEHRRLKLLKKYYAEIQKESTSDVEAAGKKGLIVASPQKAEKEPEEEEEEEEGKEEEEEEEEEMPDEESLSGEDPQHQERNNRHGPIMTMAQLKSAEPKALMRLASNRNDESLWALQQCSQAQPQSSSCPTDSQSICHQQQLLPLQQQPMAPLAELDDFHSLTLLLSICAGHKQIWWSNKRIPMELMVRDISDYLNCSENILCKSQEYQENYHELWDRAKFIEEAEKTLLFPENIYIVSRDRFLAMESAKLLPFFKRLQPADQANILRHSLIPLTMFFTVYYTLQMNGPTWQSANGHTYISVFQTKKFEEDERIKVMSKQMLCETVDHFRQVGICADEFALLIPILVSSTTSSDLSASARDILYTESVRYSKALFRLCQHKYGQNALGRYASMMSMLNVGHKFNYTYQMLTTYLEIIVMKKNGKYIFPKAISALMVD